MLPFDKDGTAVRSLFAQEENNSLFVEIFFDACA